MALLTINSSDPWHRDGWMFQVMSWIAARQASPGGTIRAPHMIQAHKGFDGLQLELDIPTETVVAAIIFEDKATTKPRPTIRTEVWRDFEDLEAGHKDNVLISEICGLLQSQNFKNLDAAIERTIWQQTRKYRVSITVGKTHSHQNGRKRLFGKYDVVAPGHVSRRRGETFFVPQMRKWMQDLAAQAISKIKLMQAASV